MEDRPKTLIDEIKEKYSEDEIREQLREFGQLAQKKREKPRVLYLDDEKDALTLFEMSFGRKFDIFTTSDPDEARKIVKDEVLHVILTDQRMPKESGVQFLESIIDKHPDPIRILVTAYSDINAVVDAINKGRIYEYIQKPYVMEGMEQTIWNAAETFFLRRDKEQMMQKLTRANSQLDFMLRQRLLTE